MFKKTAIILSLAAMVSLSACAPDYSEGSRVGVVTKISRKGLFVKSWEGSLNQGGMRSQTDSNGHVSMVPNVLDFNVSDPEVLAKIQEAAKSGKTVELVYKQWFLAPLSIENDHVIIDVKPAGQ